MSDLEEDIQTKEEEVARRFDDDIARMHREFALERERDQEKIAQAQFKMDQMSDTLKYLNGIFRTMQNDGSTLKTTDLQSVVSRLEKENRELKSLNQDSDSVKVQLAQAQQRIRQLEGQILVMEDEKTKMQAQMARRDEAIANLMEREAVRSAEIEKLQKMAKMKDDELLSLDMKDPATSVLCIKCKRSLDDLTNIKSALLGDQAMGKVQRVQCESFRILLPNLKNRKPSRSNAWLRNAMRCILLTKMREHLAWQQLKPDVVRFPPFVYGWFSRSIAGLSGSALTKALVACDEDRWALYYGCKSLGKDDPEAALFWSLLDEAFGQDGLHFLLHCLGVVLSLGGTPLWTQLGRALVQGASIEDKPDDAEVRQTIWLDLAAAKEAVALILTRALSVHVNAALEAIEALKVSPADLNQRAAQSDAQANGSEAASPTAASGPAAAAARRASMKEATHVNLFTFLRVLQQQLHADKIHRGAAIRLMFETASVGALTPALPYDNGGGGGSGGGGSGGGSSAMGHNLQGVTNTHVEYPQFQSICWTLFPRLSVAEIAGLYAVCHQHGQRRVSAEIFTQEADLRGLFVRSMVLPAMPLLRHLVDASVFDGDGDEKAADAPAPAAAGLVSSPVLLNTMSATASAAPNAADTAPFPRKTKLDTRSQLASLVHRKVASLRPLMVEYLFPRLPGVWCGLLQEALHAVHGALDETFAQLRLMRKQDEEGGAAGGLSRLVSGAASPVKGKSFAAAPAAAAASKSTSALVSAMNRAAAAASEDPVAQAAAIADTYLDGIQPYVAYRRLLSLLTLAVAVNDNPLVPAELFTGRQLADNTDRVMRRAETILTHLEEAVVLPVKNAVDARDLGLYQARVERLLDKYYRFEDVRRTLIARKLQTITRQFVHREVAVPRSVRMLMAAGYLSDHRNRQILSAGDIRRSIAQVHAGPAGQAAASAAVASVFGGGKSQGLRWREVFLDPWAGSAGVASVYLFKLDYDLKAARLGLAPLSLPQAVSAYFYHVMGTATAAERALHDLFVCVRTYRHAASRLRLFSLFLGDARESGLVPSMSAAGGVLNTSHLSASAAAAAIAAEESGQLLVEVLASPQCWTVYIQLLLRVHAAVAEATQAFAAAGAADASDATGDSSAAVASASASADAAAGGARGASKSRLVVDTLFPTTENPWQRPDKRDTWALDVDLLVSVARAWTRRQQRHWFQPGLGAAGGGHSVYTDLPEKLKPDGAGRVDVDDFLYVMVLQWAKLQVWQLQRVASRGQQMSAPHAATPRHAAAAASSAASQGGKAVASAEAAAPAARSGVLSRRLSQLPLSSLQSIADSVYQQRGGDAVVSTSSILAPPPASARDDGDEREAEESLLLSDPLHYAAAYVRCIRSRRFATTLPTSGANGGGPGGPGGPTAAAAPKTDAVALQSGAASAATVAHEQALLARMGRIETRLLSELRALIRETVLWDTNLGLFLTPQRILWRHMHTHQAAARPASSRPGGVASDASASVVSFGGGSGPNTSRATTFQPRVPSAGGRPKSSAKKVKAAPLPSAAEVEEDDLFALDVLVTEACAPEFLFSVCKHMFNAYHSVIHTFLASALASVNATASANAMDAAAASASAGANALVTRSSAANVAQTLAVSVADEAVVQNVRQRVQSVRAQLLSLSDFFAQPEQNMASDRLYHLQRLGAAPEDLVELQTLRQQHRHVAREAQFLFRALLSNIAELAVAAQLEFPRDSWHAGAKIHIDRAFAYSIHLRNSL